MHFFYEWRSTDRVWKIRWDEYKDRDTVQRLQLDDQHLFCLVLQAVLHYVHILLSSVFIRYSDSDPSSGIMKHLQSVWAMLHYTQTNSFFVSQCSRSVGGHCRSALCGWKVSWIVSSELTYPLNLFKTRCARHQTKLLLHAGNSNSAFLKSVTNMD